MHGSCRCLAGWHQNTTSQRCLGVLSSRHRQPEHCCWYINLGPAAATIRAGVYCPSIAALLCVSCTGLGSSYCHPRYWSGLPAACNRMKYSRHCRADSSSSLSRQPGGVVYCLQAYTTATILPTFAHISRLLACVCSAASGSTCAAHHVYYMFRKRMRTAAIDKLHAAVQCAAARQPCLPEFDRDATLQQL